MTYCNQIRSFLASTLFIAASTVLANPALEGLGGRCRRS